VYTLDFFPDGSLSVPFSRKNRLFLHFSHQATVDKFFMPYAASSYLDGVGQQILSQRVLSQTRDEMIQTSAQHRLQHFPSGLGKCIFSFNYVVFFFRLFLIQNTDTLLHIP
jgi:hypothetical protein